MNVFDYNRDAWDASVAKGNQWTIPVTPEQVAQARGGEVRVKLTNRKWTPDDWLGALEGKEVLALASGGGQQGPLLAAAGANVVVLDASPAQLARDREVAAREGLALRTEQGDMGDLSRFADGCFDLIFHPCSNVFRASIRDVWREAFRVLRPGGRLLSGFCNPVMILLDPEAEKEGKAHLRFSMPYSDLDLSEEEKERWFPGEAVCFAHSLEDQLGGQIDAGFALRGLYEDYGQEGHPLSKHMPALMATWAEKP